VLSSAASSAGTTAPRSATTPLTAEVAATAVTSRVATPALQALFSASAVHAGITALLVVAEGVRAGASCWLLAISSGAVVAPVLIGGRAILVLAKVLAVLILAEILPVLVLT
jgi:hypothetical protein